MKCAKGVEVSLFGPDIQFYFSLATHRQQCIGKSESVSCDYCVYITQGMPEYLIGEHRSTFKLDW